MGEILVALLGILALILIIYGAFLIHWILGTLLLIIIILNIVGE